MKTLSVLHCGTMPYEEAWALQRALARARSAGHRPDTLLLLQHPHTYTLGRASKPEHLLVTPETLVRQGVALVETDRGGDITYHGPGQVVGYPLIKLSQHGGDIIRYLRMLEDVVIGVLDSYGVAGTRIPGLTGVWVNQEKICAIGVKLTASGVTLHGWALNVSTDLAMFRQIIPCGIRDRGVTSLERVLGSAPALAEVEERLVTAFSAVFGVVPVFEEAASDVVH